MKASRTTAPASASAVLLVLTIVAGALALAACSNGNVSTATNTPSSPGSTVAASQESTAPARSAPGVGTIAFTGGTGDGDTEIYLVRPDGTGLKRLTHSATNVYAPAWSPDGGKIAYLAGGESGRPGRIWGSGTVWVVNGDGSKAHQPDPRGYGGTGWVTGVDWSPDGRQLVLTLGGLGHVDLAIMNADGSGFRILNTLREEGSQYDHPVWSPTGRILFSRTHDNGLGAICSVNPDGSGLAEVTVLPAGWGWASDFSLSQDGRWLALFPMGRAVYRAANGHGRENVFLEAKRLATLKGENRLKFRWRRYASWFIGFPTWSPDGTRIAFVGGARAGMLGDARALYIVSVDGSGLRKVPNTGPPNAGPLYGVQDLAWQPH
jgi:Tol biopolymer transport system component